ncbi:hypothetical protein WA158_003736 [Blastocystis sp. Blastoise]
MSEEAKQVPTVQTEEHTEVKVESKSETATPVQSEKNQVAEKETLEPCHKTEIRNLGGFTDYYVKYGQTLDVTIPVADLFKNNSFPTGVVVEYNDDSRKKFTPEEEKSRDKLFDTKVKALRRGAEVHRQVRAYAQSIIKPGIKLWDLCNAIEDRVRLLIGESGPQAGCGFPCGVSINSCAAHYTPNPGDETVLKYGDVMKVDFGVQYHGWIIDCAFTSCFDPEKDNLVLATKEATYKGLAMAGPDQLLGEIGAEIEEIISSYEVTIDGKVYRCKPVRNLSGHSMDQGTIHAGKSVPLVKEEGGPRMEEGEVFAIETFATTGNGYIVEGGETSHYARMAGVNAPIRLPSAQKLLKHINKTFGTIPFCRRYLSRNDGGSYAINGNKGKQTKYLASLKCLCDNGIVHAYPPLTDRSGSYISQWEHTVILKSNGKEIVSKGDDY